MATETKLFSPLRLRSLDIKNRIWVSPMCQYSSRDGHPTEWHFVHLGSRAVGGAGLVMVEASGVSPEGRISPADSGLWSEAHAESFKKITAFIKDQGSVPAIQLAHAGRKASTRAPWDGEGEVKPGEGGWQTVAPSALAFKPGYPLPREMKASDLAKVVSDFEKAAELARRAGFQVIEIHMAHGYLLHEFLSPLSNKRTDEYGGSLENRMRLPLKVAEVVRKKWPAELPLFVRISATDWAEDRPEESWKLADSIELAKRLKALGVDLIDTSSGGLIADAKIPLAPGYQVPFATAIRQQSKIATGAVGLITEPDQAESILREEKADAIFMAREFLRDAYWPARAARTLGVKLTRPIQYGRS